jgi:trehalose 6-phosphate phosphatase
MTFAVHHRAVRPPALPGLEASLRRFAALARAEGFSVARGRRVTEFLPRGIDKGRALRAIRRLARPDVVFYFGDSPGDEPAFASLSRGDFGVRVGMGPTQARYRVGAPRDVDRFLRAVIAARAAPARKRR